MWSSVSVLGSPGKLSISWLTHNQLGQAQDVWGVSHWPPPSGNGNVPLSAGTRGDDWVLTGVYIKI